MNFDITLINGEKVDIPNGFVFGYIKSYLSCYRIDELSHVGKEDVQLYHVYEDRPSSSTLIILRVIPKTSILSFDLKPKPLTRKTLTEKWKKKKMSI